MDLRRLGYFSAVADAGSISAAAAGLHMTQPALSRQIAALERELGRRLVVRSARGVVPTPAGQALSDHLRSIFFQVDRIPEVVRMAALGELLVDVGMPPGVPQPWFAALGDALAASPRLRLSLHEASTDEQRTMLRDGVIELGLMHVSPVELRSELMLVQRLGVVVRGDSPLASSASAGFADLDGLRVLAHASGEVSEEEVRLRGAATAAGVGVDWIFRRFSEHAELIADTSGADAVLITEVSAAKHLPAWAWVPLRSEPGSGSGSGSGSEAVVRTWAVWHTEPSEQVRTVLDAMRRVRDAG